MLNIHIQEAVRVTAHELSLETAARVNLFIIHFIIFYFPEVRLEYSSSMISVKHPEHCMKINYLHKYSGCFTRDRVIE